MDDPSLEKLGHVGWGPVQPELLGGSPAHDRGLEMNGL